ncbi:M14 family metallopeptidase [Maribacter polysaccharolyticus]|uniref:M14 family metallopeptidase n=1 Tax=Maribacter polysaccharolyticus TaxID=3020831 RepID=UPI00237F7874|nr:M14 family metallopeptidase [Maribacter polysaccharolyticus]MDE3740869.1 M14 family metallopeptidase [Maribacter polysaccharolyticus]
MKRILCILLFAVACKSPNENPDYDFETHFEKTGGSETATYRQTIKYYNDLAEAYPEISIDSMGKTDAGKPLHLVTYNPDAVFDFSEIRKNKRIILINNGIHPGEPDGIDATMMLFRDLVQGHISPPKNTVLATIPVYNVGGSLNRNSTTRTNQNGPKEYGFRGNARNYDLNRDFIKCDTENAQTFARIFHLVEPDVFIDNHVSNGADYQYTLTHLFTQHNKLGGNLGHYLHTKMMPQLEKKLAEKDWDITPYVNVFNRVPDLGFSQFMDYPRYSSGYTTLFNTLGMMVETHMLKPYKQRVEGTYGLMISMMEITEENGETIAELRKNASLEIQDRKTYALDWEVDATKTSILDFKGFEGEIKKSEITGLDRLKYDRSKPFTKKVTYQNHFKPTVEVDVPKAYMIPQGWWNVIDLLKLNAVEMTLLEKDTTITVESYNILSYETRKTPYEGHYMHYGTQIQKSVRTVNFAKGDYLVYTRQKAFRYLIETLEPQAPDSFFNWNFFDTVLQQKEGFSPYVWEDKALEVLADDPELYVAFAAKKSGEMDFATNWYAQLDWIHKHSKYYEKAHLQYPVYRIVD